MRFYVFFVLTCTRLFFLLKHAQVPQACLRAPFAVGKERSLLGHEEIRKRRSRGEVVRIVERD